MKMHDGEADIDAGLVRRLVAGLIAAWSVFGPAGRAAFRDALGAGDGDWDRARGVALHQAVMLVPYYRVTNPGMAALGRRTVGQVLADVRARG
jgi:aminoglycoside phosphotransferase (APT) family kinase protein